MYNATKQVILKLIPKSVLHQFEPRLRWFIFQFYRGNTFQCNICKNNLRKFIPLHEDKLCPACGSLSRDRRLYYLLDRSYLKENLKVLDFSPSRAIFRLMKKNKSIHYESSDLSGDFIADFQHDLTSIEREDGYFDLIICYHILEHIENDSKAMSELFRVLKKDGISLIQTPFKKGEIYENDAIKTKEERLKHFGQDDHVRIYSKAGLKNRLENAGFKVEVNEFKPDEISRQFGFSPDETVFICSK